MSSSVPLIVNPSTSQIQELPSGNDLNLTGSNIAAVVGVTASGNISTTANVVGANILTSGIVSTGGNIQAGGIISASGNIVTAGYFVGNFQGNVSGNLTVPGSNTQVLFNSNGNAGATAGLTFNTSGPNLLTVLGNVQAGNLLTAGTVSATGNIQGNYILGNGALLTGISGGTPSAIVNGLTNITIPSSGSNANISIGGTTNVMVFTNTGVLVTGIASVSGNVTGGNIVTAGQITATSNISSATNVTGGNLLTGGTVSALGNVTGGNIIATGIVSAAGNITGNYLFGNGSQLTGLSATYGNSNVATYLPTYSGNLTANTISTTGNITGNYILGNGSQLTGLPATYGNSNVVTLLAGLGSNSILTTGTITSGNITGANILTTGLVSVSGNVTASYYYGNGSQLTGVVATGIGTLSTLSVTGTATVGNISTAGTVSAVGNITGGNLSAGAISASGNIDSANLNTAGRVLATGNVTGLNITTGGIVTAIGNIIGASYYTSGIVTATGNITGGNVATAGQVSATGNISTAQSLITGSLTLTGNSIIGVGPITIDPNGSGGTDGNVFIAGNLSVQGNVTYINSNTVITNDLVYQLANNASSAAAANGGGIAVGPAGSEYAKWLYNSTQTAWNTAIGISATGNILSSGNITGNYIIGNGSQLTNVVANSVNTLSSLSVTGNITGGNLSVSSGTVILGNIVTSSNGVGNIGSSGNTFNTVFARATTASYADLAEKYLADADYSPGTVVSFGGTAEVTVSTQDLDPTIAGVVSTRPAYCMNSELSGAHVATVALTGRVPCQVQGPVTKGAMMVSAGNGRARAEAKPQLGTVIGKALESFNGDTGTIEIVVGRL